MRNAENAAKAFAYRDVIIICIDDAEGGRSVNDTAEHRSPDNNIYNGNDVVFDWRDDHVFMDAKQRRHTFFKQAFEHP